MFVPHAAFAFSLKGGQLKSEKRLRSTEQFNKEVPLYVKMSTVTWAEYRRTRREDSVDGLETNTGNDWSLPNLYLT